jgi:hypothetical protein
MPALDYGHTHEAHATRMRVQEMKCTVGYRSLRDGGRVAFIYRTLTAWMSLSVRRSALKLEIEAKAQIVAGCPGNAGVLFQSPPQTTTAANLLAVTAK